MDNKNNTLKSLSVRIKDKHKKLLDRMAFEVNQVWNAANEETSIWCHVPVPEIGYISNHISAFDLQKQLKDIRKERDMLIHSSTFQETIAQHGKARQQERKNKLRWRISGGARRSLGWIPFKSGAAKWVNGQIRYAGHFFNVWDSYGLSKYKFRSGSFSQDVRDRWYFNVVVEVETRPSVGEGKVGIDLGLKDTATLNNGERLERANFYRDMELELAKAQRANKKKRVKNIHAKIRNRRKDTLHKFSTELVLNNSLIVVGNVSSKGMIKRKKGFAKSVLDASWFELKRQIDYKSKAMQSVFVEVNEAYTTQTCSCCGCISNDSPKGRAGLRIREWSCPECGTVHDRDINAAKNILAAGLRRLGEGKLTMLGGIEVKEKW